MTTTLGIDHLLHDLPVVPGRRWGLITNHSAVTSDLTLSALALRRAQAPLAALLGPEHGLRGTVQAGKSEAGRADPVTGLPVLDTYRLEGTDLDRVLAKLGIDSLVFDIQDVGVRFYTYVSTMVDCLRSAGRLGLPFTVLDRPNPLSGALTEGPGLSPGFESFVGRLDIPIRHGMTVGELALLVAARDQDVGLPTPVPQVIAMTGWSRQMSWEDTGLQWVMPSPNLPTPTSALVYAGTGLFEGTVLSEGRGTTRPFELIGAPWLDEGYAAALNRLDLPGVCFRPAWYEPIHGTFEGQAVGGVQVHVTDRKRFRPVATSLTMMEVAQDLRPEEFAWRPPRPHPELQPELQAGPTLQPHPEPESEFRPRVRPGPDPDTTPLPFIDLLWGSSSLRADHGLAAAVRHLRSSRPPAEPDSSHLLYS